MKTQVIANHSLTLTSGEWYIASRPMMRQKTDKIFPVTIFNRDWQPAVTVGGLNYDQANELINAFNNGSTSFDGRVW